MTMPEMQKAMARLRLTLASIKGKEDELDSLKRQFQRQLDRASSNAVHGINSLDAAIGIMEEIQERLDNVDMKRRHLASIKKRAEDELGALDLTDKIEKAKTELASLKEHQNSGESSEKVEPGEIEQLERFIEEASIRAGEAITGRLDTDDIIGA
ncbi:MAG: hypothetical protein IIC84_08425 [Chloroflexi bacterium]|nr:hypothetical protein [Chloroflexota bacterium]